MYEKWKKVIFTIVGAGIMGAALELFLVPLHITAGGVSGISTVINHLTGISVGVLIFVINIPIFILGALNFNKSFLFFSILGTLSLSVSTEIFSVFPPITSDPLLASVFGGGGMGLGLGLVLSVAGTTGGTDIIAFVLKKRLPAFSIGQFVMLIDGIIITAAGFVFGRWEIILYSVVSLFVTTKVVDAILAGVDYAKMVYIVSENAEKISQGIYEKMRRGVTGLESVSMYNGNRRRVLLCVIRRLELPKLKDVVYDIDSDAFIIISDAREVLGKGFKTL